MLLFILPVLIQVSVFAQGYIKAADGPRIVSETGSYWVVDGAFTLTSPSAAFPVTMANLKINSGASLTIGPLDYLTVNGTLTNSAGNGGLVISSDASGTGSLLNNTAEVSALVKRYMNNADWSVLNDGWHLLGSPVASQAISPAFTTDPAADYDFYCWDEPTNLWVNYQNMSGGGGTAPFFDVVNGSTNFTVGRGYLAAYKTEGTKVFSGTMNVANIDISGLTITGSTQPHRSWHLLGNPYASALTWDATGNWNLVNISGVAKVWNEAIQDYSDITSTPSSAIPATNGFMVQVSSGTGSLTIPAAKRAHSSQPFYKSTFPSLILIARNTSAGNAKESSVYFNPDATPGFDLMYDGDFLAGYGPRFYSVAGSEHLSTNSLPDVGGTVQIPFDFIKNEGTNFTIEAESISGITGPVILNDLKTGASQDLTLNPLYAFTAAPGDNPSRFLVTFSHVGMDGPKGENTISIYTSGNMVYIQDKTGNSHGKVFVYNLTGQRLMQQELAASGISQISLSAPTGYYIVKVVTDRDCSSSKVFIH